MSSLIVIVMSYRYIVIMSTSYRYVVSISTSRIEYFITGGIKVAGEE